jgi:hypothetical protein
MLREIYGAKEECIRIGNRKNCIMTSCKFLNLPANKSFMTINKLQWYGNRKQHEGNMKKYAILIGTFKKVIAFDICVNGRIILNRTKRIRV